jgi:hypothetical protein
MDATQDALLAMVNNTHHCQAGSKDVNIQVSCCDPVQHRGRTAAASCALHWTGVLLSGADVARVQRRLARDADTGAGAFDRDSTVLGAHG